MQRDSDSHESLRCAWPGERRVELDDERPLKHSTRTSQPHRLPLSHSTVRPGHHHRQRQPAPGVHTGTRTHSTVHTLRQPGSRLGINSHNTPQSYDEANPETSQNHKGRKPRQTPHADDTYESVSGNEIITSSLFSGIGPSDNYHRRNEKNYSIIRKNTTRTKCLKDKSSQNGFPRLLTIVPINIDQNELLWISKRKKSTDSHLFSMSSNKN